MLSLWVSGDICGVLGLVLTGQHGTLLYTQSYYLAVDLVLLAQWLFFRFLYKSTPQQKTLDVDTSPPVLVNASSGEVSSDVSSDVDSHSPSPYPSSHLHSHALHEHVIAGEAIHNQHQSTPVMVATTPYGHSVGHLAIVMIMSCLLSVLLDSSHAFAHPTVPASISPPLSSLSFTSLDLPDSSLLHRGSSSVFSTMNAPDGFLRYVDPSQNISPPGPSPQPDPASSNLCTFSTDLSRVQKVSGIVFAWLCFLLYSISRFPQALLNYRRKTTNGLSRMLVITSITAYVLYSLSIFLPTTRDFSTVSFYTDTLPYVLSTVFSCGITIVILVQILHYQTTHPGEVAAAAAVSEHSAGESGLPTSVSAAGAVDMSDGPSTIIPIFPEEPVPVPMVVCEPDQLGSTGLSSPDTTYDDYGDGETDTELAPVSRSCGQEIGIEMATLSSAALPVSVAVSAQSGNSV